MAPPRFQCLNAGKQLTQRSSSFRATFSTSRVASADEPSARSPSATDLLASLGAEAPSRKTNPNLYTNPIRTSLRQTSSPPYPSPSSSSPNGHKASAGVLRLLNKANARAQNSQNPHSTTLEDMQKYKLSADLSKQISRRWKAGDVYAPHDLSAVEMGKWKSRGRPTHDVFDVLDFNPLEHYRNFSIMSEYMTPMGRIKHSNETGLRPVNQRRIAKAIRRSIGMGMMPSVHRHPEILQKLAARQQQSNSPYRNGPL